MALRIQVNYVVQFSVDKFMVLASVPWYNTCLVKEKLQSEASLYVST